MRKKVWVLTCEHNDYDQHGAYFSPCSPTSLPQNLWPLFVTGYYVDAGYLEHVRGGGGRRNLEDVWYNLSEEILL